MEQKQRLEFIDRAKGYGILMVVFSHLCSMTGFGNRLWSWYNPFMLTLFFMISGGMRKYQELRRAGGHKDFSGFVSRKAYALLLPYFVFDILALGLQTVLSYWRGGIPEAMMKLQTGAVRIITLQGLGPDWFLPALFFGELLFELCLRAGGKSVAEIRQYAKSGAEISEISGKEKNQPAGGRAQGQSLPAAAAALFAVSVFTVFCLGGDRLAVLGPFRFVIVKSLAAAGFLVLGYAFMPVMEKVFSSRQMLFAAAAVSLVGTLLIAGRYNLDFNQLDFGSRPLFLYIETLCGTCFVLCISRLPDIFREIKAGKTSAESMSVPGMSVEGMSAGKTSDGLQPGLLQQFGRESLTIMCTHLEWQIVPIIHLGWAAVAGMAPQEGKRFYAEMFVKLCLVMAVELGLIRVLHSLMPWLYRRK